MLAAERPLGCVEKGGQQSIFTLGQRDLGSAGIGETPGAPIELPAAELAPAPLRIPLRRGAAGLLPSQHGTDARQKFPKAERLGDIVVGPQFQSDHPVDLVASIPGGDDYRNIGARSDLAQQVEPVLLAKPEVEDDEIRLACGEMMDQLLPPRCRDGAHIVMLEIVHDHASHDRVILDNADARLLIVGRAHVQVRLAKCQGSVSAYCVDMWGDPISQVGRTACFTLHRATSYGETRNGCQIAYFYYQDDDLEDNR